MMHQNSGGASRDTAVRIVDLMIRFGPQILLLLGTILTILTSAFPDASFSVSGRIIALRWFFALCAVAFLVIGTFASFRSGSLLGKRQREVEQARGLIERYRVSTENLLRFLLAELLREIQLTTEKGVPKPEVRGSIYCPTTDYEHFLLIARKTGNPEWERPRSRQYKAGMGAIDKCWQLGSSIVRAEGFAGQEWVNFMVEDYGLPNEVASEIRMQSQRMVLVRLESTDGNPVGVLVVESTDHRMLSLKKQDEIVGSEIYPLLCQVVQSIKDPHLTAFSQ